MAGKTSKAKAAATSAAAAKTESVEATTTTTTAAAATTKAPAVTKEPSNESNKSNRTAPRYHDSEPNPFERSFSGTAGSGVNDGAMLPSVAALTSPAPPGQASSMAQLNGGWSPFGSLRSGPLSPAMLLGPSGLAGYDGSMRTGLTPNESSIRTGLTPRGDTNASANAPFPMASPGTAALFGLMNSGSGLTPGGSAPSFLGPGASSFMPSTNLTQQDGNNLYTRPHGPSNLNASVSMSSLQRGDASHTGPDAETAANGLFLLSQHSQQHPQPHAEDLVRRATVNQAKQMTGGYEPGYAAGRSLSPEAMQQRAGGSHAMSAQQEEGQGGARPSGKKNSRRKASYVDEADAAEKPKTKRARSSKAQVSQPQQAQQPQKVSDSGNESDEMHGGDGDEGGADGEDGPGMLSSGNRNETDEEKRRNFLERNRQAALKCRQRKKQWLQNLQAKVEFYGQENDQLTSQVTSLREEIVQLKTILLAHKDCPGGRSEGPVGY